MTNDTWYGAAMLLQRAALFALLWWLLAEGDPASWTLGLPFVLLATLFGHRLAPPSPRSPLGLLRFVPFFASHSLRGAIDVSRRALHPAMPIVPVLIDYPMRLRDDKARVFMANTVSLLPGTLCARLEGAMLLVHVLDGRGAFRAELEELERRVATLFRDPMEAGDAGRG